MLFHYKAQTARGDIVEGEAEAPDKFFLATQFKKKNYTLLVAREIASKRSRIRTYLESTLGVIHLNEKIVFVRSLSAMLSAGLSLSRALSALKRQTKNKAFQNVISDLERSVGRGDAFHKALSRFPNVFSLLATAMVKAGEESGNLPGSLKIIAEHLEKTYELRRKIRGALFYPVVIVAAMVVIGILMLTYVVPTLTSTFTELGVELPFLTRVIIGISSAFATHPVFVFGGLLAFIAVLIAAARSSRGKHFFDFLFLKIPFIGTLTRELNSARMARTISSLLTAGVTLLEALKTTEDVVQNSYYKKSLEDGRGAVERGMTLSFMFNRHEELYPVLVGEMTSVGEETGKLPEMLLNLAIFYEEEVAQKTKDLSTIIEPILMIFIGIAVGLFAVSMITPLYSVLENV